METLHVAETGVFLGKYSERLVIRRGRDTVSEHALLHLEQVVVSGRGVSFSADLVEECCARGIAITLLKAGGKPYARVAPAEMPATVLTRRAQLAAYADARGARVARAIAEGKLRNQANLLRYFAKYRRSRATVSPGGAAPPEEEARLPGTLARAAAGILALREELAALPAISADALRPHLMNREGRAGALYWAAVAALLGPSAAFPGREHRGAAHPLNAALNYGYGILQSQVWTAITLAGLEPHGGFIHVDRPGRPSLVLDLMEEFRQPVVDRPLLAAWGRGWRPRQEPGSAAGEGEAAGEAPAPLLTVESRREVAARILERLETATPYGKKRQSLKNVIQLQARHLAVVVRGESEYAPYVAPW